MLGVFNAYSVVVDCSPFISISIFFLVFFIYAKTFTHLQVMPTPCSVSIYHCSMCFFTFFSYLESYSVDFNSL